MNLKENIKEAIDLLKMIISIPSYSTQEEKLADFIFEYFESKKLQPSRKRNNIWLKNKGFCTSKPTILLNSHIDTVKSCEGWIYNPLEAKCIKNRIYGLGANDAGASLVSLIFCFLYFNGKKNLDFNLILALTAEEEISGKNGIELIKKDFGKIDFAIIGEPTSMQMAIAEKGLMVLDCYTEGTSSHAAYPNDDNAIYNALKDIQWFKSYVFEKQSALLGSTQITVTQINSGTQHNVIPDKSHYVVDVRINERYTLHEVLEIIIKHTECKVQARSIRLNPSSIPMDHPIVKKGIDLGLKHYGSQTLSDQALLDVPSLKLGPGDSKRSHTANEFVHIEEIEQGVETYLKLLENLNLKS